MQCARAFGALIEMRDSHPDAEIPFEFPVSDYHVKQEVKARELLLTTEALSLAESNDKAAAEYQREVDAYHERKERRATVRHRYESMLERAKAWDPPSADHVEMKQFMIQQLEESIKFDCDGSYDKFPIFKARRRLA